MIELAMRVLGLLGSVLLLGSGILAQVREQVAAPAATLIAETATNANVRDTQRPTPMNDICAGDLPG
jgi:hypothetical protein